jgi:hypothetical protein
VTRVNKPTKQQTIWRTAGWEDASADEN